MALADNIKKIMGERGESLSSVCKKANLAKGTVAGWMEGVAPRNLQDLVKLADALNVSLDHLIANRREETDLDKLLDKVSLHTGLYEISIKKVSKK